MTARLDAWLPERTEQLRIRAAEDAVVGIVLFIFLMIRPTGVFGEAEVRRV